MSEGSAVAGSAVTEGSGRVRCFFAVNLSVATTRRLAESLEVLRQPAKDARIAASWVPAANLHVTLKFLGSIRGEAVEGARDLARELAANEQPFELRARGMGAFPSTSHARVLWVGIERCDALVRLASRLDERLGDLGFEREGRPFHPHVTIARIRDERGADVGKLFAPLADRDLGTSSVGEVVFYESRATRVGSEYRPLARLPLGGAT